MAVFAVADRPIEADRIPAHRQYAASFVDRSAGFAGRLFDRRFAAETLQQFSRNIADARHGFDHVHRDANRAALIGDGARDRLTDPPRRVSAKLKTAAIFELIDGPHQASVAFLNEIEKAQAAIAIFLGDRND